MKFGFFAVNSEAGIRPGRLAAELEGRGYESVWMPEHSHIPTSRRTPYPAGGDLPDGYLHMMSPFVSLAAAVGTTSTLTLERGCAWPWNTTCSTWRRWRRHSTS